MENYKVEVKSTRRKLQTQVHHSHHLIFLSCNFLTLEGGTEKFRKDSRREQAKRKLCREK
jgi:hypothetical protein